MQADYSAMVKLIQGRVKPTLLLRQKLCTLQEHVLAETFSFYPLLLQKGV